MVDNIAEGSREFGSVLGLDLPGLVILRVLPATVELIYLLLCLALYLDTRRKLGQKS